MDGLYKLHNFTCTSKVTKILLKLLITSLLFPFRFENYSYLYFQNFYALIIVLSTTHLNLLCYVFFVLDEPTALHAQYPCCRNSIYSCVYFQYLLCVVMVVAVWPFLFDIVVEWIVFVVLDEPTVRHPQILRRTNHTKAVVCRKLVSPIGRDE